MNLPRFFIIIIFLYSWNISFSQIIISGHVSDKQGSNLFAVNTYLLQHNTIGTITDADGNFILKFEDPNLIKNEFLMFSFIGYETLKIAFDSINYSLPVNVVMIEKMQSLNEVVVEGRKSISREFSIKEMDKLKIYLNPLASADPLKAIALLPSSTNTSETANPELRGSKANRTKLFLNGVPVSNPVRNSQINGIGYYSLLNTELIKNMLVYPSNPPLIYGNTSGGMIDIETDEELESNNYQISLSLATAGISISQKINSKSFIQTYGNLMSSKGYLAINPGINEKLKSFNSNDIGINYHNEINKNFTLNFYNYLVSESSDVLLNLFTWEDNAKARTIRDFSILNLKYHKSKSLISLNAGTNISNSRFSFGNISSESKTHQLYLSVNYKFLFSEKFSIQTGLSNEYGNFSFNDKAPVYYYAMSPLSPAFKHDTIIQNNLTESYLYLRWKPFNKIILGVGIRKNIRFQKPDFPDFYCLQTNLRYNFNNNHSFLFSAGKYNNLTEPNYSMEESRLLSSNQVALEYFFENRNSKINLATYSKFESGDTTGNKTIKGFEFYIEQTIYRNFKVSLSNTILNSEVGSSSVYNEENNAGYFFVASLSYFNADLFNFSIALSNREGRNYNRVNSAIYNTNIDFYQPVYGEDSDSKRFRNYNNITFSINKTFVIHKSNLVVFASIFNILNTENPKSIIYNKDYSDSKFDYYQKRSVYFGCQISLK